jgi:hypothetical protein
LKNLNLMGCDEARARAHAAFDAEETRVAEIRKETGLAAIDDRLAEYGKVCKAAFHAMLATEPTTIAGAAALAQYLYDDAAGHLEECDALALGALTRALNALAQSRVAAGES